MEHYLHVFFESLIETGKILPLLFVVYYLIELVEYKYAIKFQNNKLFRGKASPVIGSVIGCIPQCGFSVVSTDLFSRKIISIGALIAVYIATSDEAIPIMISNPSSIPWMLLLLGIKLVAGVLIGYLALLFYKIVFKTKCEHLDHEEDEDHDHDEEEIVEHSACCHHHVDSKHFDWLHPMLHCLKICAFVLVINFIMSCITHIWVGEDNLMKFLNASVYVQPLLAVIIGLIPNCASSVALTELFLIGGLKFSALLAGLCVNAGLGIVVLLKQNKNWKENLFIFMMMIVSSLILGYSLLFI